MQFENTPYKDSLQKAVFFDKEENIRRSTGGCFLVFNLNDAAVIDGIREKHAFFAFLGNGDTTGTNVTLAGGYRRQ